MIKPDQFPYETPVALVYDVGNYEASLDRALEVARSRGATPATVRAADFPLPRLGAKLEAMAREAAGLAA